MPLIEPTHDLKEIRHLVHEARKSSEHNEDFDEIFNNEFVEKFQTLWQNEKRGLLEEAFCGQNPALLDVLVPLCAQDKRVAERQITHSSGLHHCWEHMPFVMFLMHNKRIELNMLEKLLSFPWIQAQLNKRPHFEDDNPICTHAYDAFEVEVSPEVSRVQNNEEEQKMKGAHSQKSKTYEELQQFDHSTLPQTALEVVFNNDCDNRNAKILMLYDHGAEISKNKGRNKWQQQLERLVDQRDKREERNRARQQVLNI